MASSSNHSSSFVRDSCNSFSSIDDEISEQLFVDMDKQRGCVFACAIVVDMDKQRGCVFACAIVVDMDKQRGCVFACAIVVDNSCHMFNPNELGKHVNGLKCGSLKCARYYVGNAKVVRDAIKFHTSGI